MEESSSPYPSNLTNAQWEAVRRKVAAQPSPYKTDLPNVQGGGRRPPDDSTLRRITNGVLYQASTKIPWRFLPRDIHPTWRTVYNYARTWEGTGFLPRLFAAVGLVIQQPSRIAAGRARKSPGRRAAGCRPAKKPTQTRGIPGKKKPVSKPAARRPRR